MARVDCHVHSEYSKYIDGTLNILTWLGAKECFSKLEDVYQTAKARGMDYVAITDHDTIEGALILNDKYPDVIIGEELEVKASIYGNLVHIVALGIDEKIHSDLTHLKRVGIKETVKYLKERDIFHFLAHVSNIPSVKQPNPKLIEELMNYVDTLEVGNALASVEENVLTSLIVVFYGKNKVAGSDAHVLDSIGKAWTGADDVNTKEEFLQALKQGKCYVSECRGCNSKQLTKRAVKYTKDIYKDILFHPTQRNRPATRKYLLDYVKLAALAPFAATRFSIYLYSWNYQRKTKKQVLSLTDDFLKFITRKRK